MQAFESENEQEGSDQRSDRSVSATGTVGC